MKFFRNISIRIKVLIPPVILILALGIVSLLAIYGLRRQHKTLSSVNDIALDKITLVNEFSDLSERVQADVFRIAVLSFMNLPKKEIQPVHEHLEQRLSDLHVIYGQMFTKWQLDGTERAILERMKEPMDAFRQQALQAATVVSDNPSFGVLLVRSSTVSFAEFRKILSELLNYQQAKIVRAEIESNKEAKTVSIVIVAVALLIALAGILSTVLISTRLISYPIRSITDLMSRLTKGELSIEVPDGERRDEIGSMAKAVEVFRNNAIEKAELDEELKNYSEHLEEMVEERTKELREAQERLVRQGKLAVLGQMAGGVAHELRNPLGAIKNIAYFLNMVLEEPEPEIKESLEILDKEVKTSDRIIGSLLEFARPKPLVKGEVNINEVVTYALSRNKVPLKVEVVMKLDEVLSAIPADSDKLSIVFDNIIRNAIQAMPEGGQLVIKSEMSDTDEPSERGILVSFADTGVGIPEENMPRLFEPLFTTKSKGIGLGLAIINSLVEGHGGTIEVESEVGKGSVFTVRLPLTVG